MTAFIIENYINIKIMTKLFYINGLVFLSVDCP